MSLTLLFDLDDTLLDTNIEEFIPAYFQSLSKHLEPFVDPSRMLGSLLGSMNLMMENTDPSRTLQDVFEQDFYSKINVSKDQLSKTIDDFYDQTFPQLSSTTRIRPAAASLVEWARSQNFRMAIATDPLFPRKATIHRLMWAGLDPADFELVSTFEDFHFSKSTPAYYAEVMGRMGWPDGPVLMVGNDVQRDLVPANKLGLATYFLDDEPASSPGFEAGRGDLADLRPWLESTDLSTLEPSYKSPDAIMAVLRSTPAVMQIITKSLTESDWMVSNSDDAWALNEIVCHLRDTELEIHAMQLDLMLERDDVFIPRPDSSVWASDRDYMHEDGRAALLTFMDARIKNLARLESLHKAAWSRRVRHAIFGPSTFMEVVGFMADHDRMHIQQTTMALLRLRNERV